ncbi:phage tail protein [Seonamhaeicola sp. MEBiC1930]|uniref:phage tail protein n=1 Tax=Seonamhaeicola sp. MEBiC01930 TaxID=2976768 RepID=UPI003250170B
MKTKFTLLTLLMLFVTSINFAQISFNNADIAVQGIARDDNNTALAGKSVNFTFTIYYDALSPKNIFTQAITLQTDAFGVFSHTLNVGTDKIALIANQQAFLRIEAEGNIISNEALKHVPYAISANNGVPTGAIMPFIGTVAPVGWVMCDGSDLPTDGSEVALKALLSGATKAPDLRGLFIRGVGRNSEARFDNDANERTLGVNTTQDDDNLRHQHAAGTLATSIAGEHRHNVAHSINDSNLGSVHRTAVNRSVAANGVFQSGMWTSTEGAHNHTITGAVDWAGSESRPINYGVNYIIKL